jgi:hypothetical protein
MLALVMVTPLMSCQRFLVDCLGLSFHDHAW